MSNDPYSTYFRFPASTYGNKHTEYGYRLEVGTLDGTSDPTIPFPSLLTAIATTAGYVKIWDGSVWNLKPVKVWSGTSWVIKPAKYWNGSAWTLA